LKINDYISSIESTIESSPFTASYNLNIDRKSDEIAFISGIIEFRNGSVLDFKEFIESTGRSIEKYKYAYNYRKGTTCLFRYDNAPDPAAKNIKTFPHHKHLKDGSIAESRQINLPDVLNEIESSYATEEQDF